jgi:anthranilate 1,2-dioxygenase ferredoxin component
MKELVLGSQDSFQSFPAEVEIKYHPYFLFKDEGGYRLISRICPHAGYPVDIEGGEFLCPLHGWAFELESGRCTNVSSASLSVFPVIVRDGELIALVE